MQQYSLFSRMRKLILLLCLFIHSKLFAQKTECNVSAEVTVTPNEIILSSSKFQIKKDINKNYVVFYPEGEKHSFWYKIIVESDCRFSFQVSSADTASYNYFCLYKEPEKQNFCELAQKKKIIPSRSGEFFYENKPRGFVKISSGKKTDDNVNFIHPVTAVKGEIYYLNVQHKSETECGHYLKLIVSSEVVHFRATHPKCVEDENIVAKRVENNYEKKMETIKAAVVENNSEKEVIKMVAANPKPEQKTTEEKKPVNEISVINSQKRKIEFVTVTGIILDSITQKPLQAELKWKDEISGREIVAHTNSNGEYSIALDEKVIYKLTCTTVGYREKTVKFIRQNLNSDTLVQNFSMTALQAGDNFVLKHIYFYAGTYAMKPESQPELEKLQAFLSSNEKVKIEIQGHTNGEGKIKKKKNNKKKNEEGWDFHGNEKKLSKYRAEAIKNFLVKNGISQDRISTQGLGASKMIYPEPKNQKERDANKRVEVYILPAPGDLALGN